METGRGGEELLNKVILVFFVHKKHSRSFIKLRLNHSCHSWTILLMFLIHFWILNVVGPLLSMEGQKALRFNQKYLILFSVDEKRF